MTIIWNDFDTVNVYTGYQRGLISSKPEGSFAKQHQNCSHQLGGTPENILKYTGNKLQLKGQTRKLPP